MGTRGRDTQDMGNTGLTVIKLLNMFFELLKRNERLNWSDWNTDQIQTNMLC